MYIAFLLLIVFAALAPQGLDAQPTILHGPVVDAVTYTTARVTWITDVPSSTEIRYGLSPSYDGTTVGGDNLTVHSWYLSGLAPGTTYHFKVCSTVAPSRTTCSEDRSVTTVYRDSTRPFPPEPPRARVDTSMPAGGYGEPFVIDENCSNLRSVLSQIAELSGELNYEVRIPARTACRGQFVFPARPNHTGWIVVRSTEADSLPEGVRLQADATARLATFITNAAPAGYGIVANIDWLGRCSPDSLFWSVNTPGVPLFVCGQAGTGPQKTITDASWTGTDAVIVTVPGHAYNSGDVVRISGTGIVGVDNASWRITVLDENRFALDGSRGRGTFSGSGTAVQNQGWRQVPHTSGSELPQTCSPNDWFFRTESTEPAYWCTSTGQWTNVRFINTTSGENFSAIQFAPNAARYRFIGIEVTHIPMPNPPPPGWSSQDYRQGTISSLITTRETNSHIIFDRCDVHGLDYPSRLTTAINLDGANVAVIDSRIHKVNRWAEKPDGINLESFAIMVNVGPGPGKIANNFLETIGITLFFPDGSPDADAYHRTPAADYEIVRNYFSHPETYLVGSPLNNSGKHYTNRHHFELKRGRRMLIEGNVFDTNWADINQGAFVALTPRPGSVPPAKVIKAINDGVITLSSSLQPYQPGMLVYVSGSDNASFNGIWEVESRPMPNQVKLINAPSGAASSGTVVAVGSDIQISDIDFRNNIFRYGPNVLWITGHQDWSGGALNTKTTQRLRFINNLIYGMDTGRAAPASQFQSNRPGILVFAARGMEDLIVRNNTVADFKGFSPTLLFLDNTRQGAHAGLDVRDNIFLGPRAVPAQVSGSLHGQPTLDQQWTAHPRPAWTFSNNVFCCTNPAMMRQNQLSAPNTWIESETHAGFQDVFAGNFRLQPSSPIKALGTCLADPIGCLTNTDDPGVDMGELERHLSPDNPPLILR
jgi:hypothetical protein